jgi:hypothetical protein
MSNTELQNELYGKLNHLLDLLDTALDDPELVEETNDDPELREKRIDLQAQISQYKVVLTEKMIE